MIRNNSSNNNGNGGNNNSSIAHIIISHILFTELKGLRFIGTLIWGI